MGDRRTDDQPAGSGNLPAIIPPVAPALPDRIGRYLIKGELGRGAMGVVYFAIDPAIGRPVAIKTIRIRDIHNQAQQDKLRERLFREARSAGALSHPNIVTIYDMDEDDGLAYIAMAFVNGPTLEKVLSSRHAISGQQALHVLRQSARALDYAHGRGIIHRDVKPGNIMIDDDGTVKITDFGIARFAAPGNTTETRTVTGTPSYMSPEQVQGLPVDGRSDQFSLGVITYEIFTGERPFHGEHLSTVVYRIVAEEPADALRINPTLSPQIDAVLRRALAKKPENRFPNCTAFLGALEMACAESRGWKPIPSGSAHTMPTVGLEPGKEMQLDPGTPAFAIAPPSRETPPPRQSRLVSILVGVLVAAGLSAVFAREAGMLPGLDTISEFLGISSPPAPQPPAPTPAGPVADVPGPPQADTPPADQPATDDKPSPVADAAKPPAPSAPDVPVAPPAPEVKTPARPRAQDVWVTTNPPGAKVVLDDDASGTCAAPCMLHGTPGVHHLTYSLNGYSVEYREIHVGDTALDAPVVALRPAGGTLMLTTNPPGASVAIDGKALPSVTPAQISLAPGRHSVTVQLGGRTQTQQVEMNESPVYLRFTLVQ